jgi:hypothetical protein
MILASERAGSPLDDAEAELPSHAAAGLGAG